MAISINWGTKVIYVPKSDLTLISGSLYELDVNQFRLDLKNLEDTEEGMAAPTTHNHNKEVTLAGTTYARAVEIINGYTVTFEDGQYTVRCVGANHNIGDVKNVNQVSLIVNNAAGLIVTSGGGSLTITDVRNAVWNALQADYLGAGTMGASQASISTAITLAQTLLKYQRNRTKVDQMAYTLTIYDDDGTTPIRVFDLRNFAGLPSLTEVAERIPS